ncbi:hypothetical protein BGX29_001415 [Mortierella sp. GBA35]|nr:hypothetical protein BGX29_001415 [Mortierella sp. GBA35]
MSSSSGHIHFVTPTNRWVGSIPLSTLDPLTLEPLSTYIRPDPPKRQSKNAGEDNEDEKEKDGQVNGKQEEEEEETEDMKERTTNIAGDPISLILARLQTMPQGCSCGCTVPEPPKHSDYYHAQHLLRLLFQTQRVRSRSLKTHLPHFFERLAQEQEDEEGGESGSESESEDEVEVDECSEDRQHRQQPSDSVVIPIDSNGNGSSTTLTLGDSQPHPQSRPQRSGLQQLQQQQTRKKKLKMPRYVQSLVQNRNFRNPLTNTEIEGDPTFFVVLEPGKGGWWHEPWAMATQPAGIQRFHSLHQQYHHHHHHLQQQQQEAETVEAERTPEMVQLEKELRKERWRQGRVVNLELEAQREMDWRRWSRCQATYAAEAQADAEGEAEAEAEALAEGGCDTGGQQQSSEKRRCGRRGRGRGREMMRLKLGKDIALLEPSERGLRLPRRIRSRSTGGHDDDRGEKKSGSLLKKTAGDAAAAAGYCTTAVSNNNDIGLFRSVQASAALDEVELEDIRQQQQQQKDSEEIKNQPPLRMTNKCRRRLTRVHRRTAPGSPLSSTSTNSAEGGAPSTLGSFSFLPWWDPDPQPFQMPTTKLSPFAISTLPEPVAKLFGGTSIYARIPKPAPPPSTSQETGDSSSTPTSTLDRSDDEEANDSTSATITSTSSAPDTKTSGQGPPIPKNEAGCQWVPVKHGDRVAVMIGTSKDFLLFPSFQRLLFRHLSREDFEDRVARVNIIPCPATAIVVGNGPQHVQQQLPQQGQRLQQQLQQQQQQQQRSGAVEIVGAGGSVDSATATGLTSVSVMEEGGQSSGRPEAVTCGMGSRWLAWMSPRRNAVAANTAVAPVVVRTVSETGNRPPLPPPGETMAFVGGSGSSSNSSSSSTTGAGEDSPGGQDRNEKGGRTDDLVPIPNNNLMASSTSVDVTNEKEALDFTSTSIPTTTPTATKTTTTLPIAVKETREEEQRRWQMLEEGFLREDYDSSEYSYASSSDEEDEELSLDYDGPYYSSEESASSDEEGSNDDGDEESRGQGRRGGVRSTRWGIRDWIYFVMFCKPHPRTTSVSTTTTTTTTSSSASGSGARRPMETRRARRRRLRRECWRRMQDRQREQESEVLHRYLPTVVRR